LSSLEKQLKPHVEKLKVHKPPLKLTGTERRLNQMTAIILNKKMSQEVKDRLLKKLVADSQIEARLEEMNIHVGNPIHKHVDRHNHR